MISAIGIVGTGRLGATLARRTPPDAEKILVNRTRQRAEALARKCERARAGDVADLAAAQVVFLAIPSPEMALAAAAPHLAPRALVVNCATGTLSRDLRAQFPHLDIVGAKIVGNVADLSAPHLIVIDGADHRQFDLVHRLMSGIGHTVRGSEEQARAGSELAVEAALRACAEIEQGMARLRLPAAWRRALLSALAAGTIRAYADGELDAFTRAVLARQNGERG